MKLGLGSPPNVADLFETREPEFLLFAAKPWPAPPAANDNGERIVVLEGGGDEPIGGAA